MGLLLVLVVAIPVLWARIGTLPLLDPDEAKHAEVAREMLVEGRWLEPVVYGQPYHHKPSLLYLLIGICYRVVGVGELGARIVPAAAGLTVVVVTYLAAARRRVADGLLAALLLLSAPLFFAVARFTNFDGLLTLVSFAAILTAARWMDDPEHPARDRRLLVFGVLTGLGVLVKGPAAAVLLLPPFVVLGFSALRTTPPRALAIALAAFVIVVASWMLPTALLHPDYLYDFLWVHNVQRYSVDADLFHPEPFWFFLPVLLTTLLPWSLLVPHALVAGWRGRRGERLLVAYAAWVVLFFSSSSGKLATYVLPAYPVFALFVARWLGDESTSALPRRSSWLTRAVAIVYLLIPAAVYLVVRREEPGFESAAAGLLLLPLAGLAVLRPPMEMLRTERGATAALAVGMLATYAVVLTWLAPVVGRFTSDRDLVATLVGVAPPPDRVVVNKVRPFSFLFYSRWPVVYKVTDDEYRAALTAPGRVYVLTKPTRVATLVQPDPPVELREIASNHRHVVFERVVRGAPSDDHDTN